MGEGRRAVALDEGVRYFDAAEFCDLFPDLAPNIRYVFAGSWDGPAGMAPPPDVMRNWIMWALLWTPPA